MAKSEAAKALEEKNRAEIKLRKAQKKNSDNPQDWSTWRQIRYSYTETAKYDKQLPLLMALCIGGPFLVLLIVGLLLLTLVHWPWWNVLMLVLIGLMIGLFLAIQLLQRRAQGSMYKRFEGQAGSAEVALRTLGKEWVTKPVIAVNRNYDSVHRALGPGGLVLIGEGEAGRTRALLAQEAKRHEQVAYGIKVQQIMMGDKPGQVPLSELGKHLKKLPKQLSKTQIDETAKRLTALDAVRQRMPIPKGPMPTRQPSRRAMRGR